VTKGTVSKLTSGTTLVRNTIWNIVGQVVPLLTALVAIPITLRGLGTARFGALSLAWLLIGYFSLFDLGLGRALTATVAEKLAARREEDIPPLAWTALFLMLGLGVLGGVLITLPAAWLVERVLNIPLTLQGETRQALYLLGISLPFVISTAGLRGLLEAKQCFGLVNAARIPMGVLTFVGPVLVLPFSRSLVAVVGLLAAVRLASWAVHLALCLHVFPSLREGPALHPPMVAPLLRLGGWMTVTNVVGPLMVYLDRFLIGGLMTLAAVAYYATPYEMVTKLLLVPSAIAQVLFPAFSASLVGDRPRAALLFERGLKSVFLFLFPLTLLLVTLAPELLRLWLGAEFARESTRVLQWLAVGVLVNGLAQIPFALVQGAGHPDFTARLHLLELPFYLAGVWWLIQVGGVEGAAIAWTARATVDAAVLLLMAERTVPALPGARWRTASLLTGLGVCFLACLWDTLLAKELFLIASLTAFGILSWNLVLTADERLLARTHLWRILSPSGARP
jgi:O-antigen/teichoic acid export membrane protein